MPPVARVTIALAALAGIACGRSSTPQSTLAGPSPGPQRTVTGWITEIEYGKLSIRTTDGRSLIFTLEHPPTPVNHLRQEMGEQSPIRITYRAAAGQLVPLRIDEPCPGPDCPPPYTQPSPFSTPSPIG